VRKLSDHKFWQMWGSTRAHFQARIPKPLRLIPHRYSALSTDHCSSHSRTNKIAEESLIGIICLYTYMLRRVYKECGIRF